ncbi:beta-1,4-galactosyltransferase galt-1-like [Haliotis rubra]|uniref:beta-1,4-galactosyltransferase galt-1-like n=1 Tax=Haliotis rubra TaxID=36100 RepID=UPI001EE6092B|nr:beta-1,4-galactosyltransferase galt-1-like [Haliotis rubra]
MMRRTGIRGCLGLGTILYVTACFILYHHTQDHSGQKGYPGRSPSQLTGNCAADPVNPRPTTVYVKLTEDVFLYSAFFDGRLDRPFIRLLGINNRRKNRTKLWCHFVSDVARGVTIHHVTSVTDYEMCESHNYNFAGWIWSCVVPEVYAVQGRQPRHVRVGLSEDIWSAPSVDMSVLGTGSRIKEPRFDFTVCVPPLFGSLTVHDIVQFVEVSRILGANHFVFYNLDTQQDLQATLNYYKSIGLVSVYPWKIPFNSVTTNRKQNIWYHGQSIAANDCLYRHMFSTKYIIFNDLDEFLVPRDPDIMSWKDLTTNLYTPELCGISFERILFNINKLYNVSKLRMTVFNALGRRATPPRPTTSRKVMVEPSKVFEMGIHHVSRPWPDVAKYRVDHVSPDKAFIHHYRQKKNIRKERKLKLQREMINDTLLFDKYGSVIFEKYINAFRKIKKIEGIRNLSNNNLP